MKATFEGRSEIQSWDVDDESLAAIFGTTPEKLEPTFSLSVVTSTYCPIPEPHKRRGLTGKRYRSARRRYAREMRAWRRSGSPMASMRTVLPRVILSEGEGGVIEATVAPPSLSEWR